MNEQERQEFENFEAEMCKIARDCDHRLETEKDKRLREQNANPKTGRECGYRVITCERCGQRNRIRAHELELNKDNRSSCKNCGFVTIY